MADAAHLGAQFEHFNPGWHQMEEDSPHLSMALEAGRRHVARSHDVQPNRVKMLWAYSRGEVMRPIGSRPHPRQDTSGGPEYETHYGWTTPAGKQTGATYAVNAEQEQIRHRQTWPEYERGEGPYSAHMDY